MRAVGDGWGIHKEGQWRSVRHTARRAGGCRAPSPLPRYMVTRVSLGMPKNISGAHVILFSTNAEADREFLRTVLKFPYVDAGEGWLIFALPPSELAVHPAETSGPHELYLMCDDIQATIKALKQKKVKCSVPKDRGWGTLATIRLPGGGKLGLYQPNHPLAHHRRKSSA